MGASGKRADPLDELVREVINQFHEFREFKYLFYGGQARVDLLNGVAKHFFGELFYVSLERLVLGVSKLTDPPGSGARTNFSLSYVHEELGRDPRYPLAEATALLGTIKPIRAHLARWRSKLIAHKDRRVAEGEADPGEVKAEQVEQFFEIVAKYVELASQALERGPCPIDTTAYFGADELVRVLKRGVAFADLLEEEPRRYGPLLQDSRFYDA